ncbi:MAG: amidohydrolase [Candidatus Pristimantibacillus sp.]
MRIDAHQHCWAIKRGDYGWITPEVPVLYRDYLPIDLEPILQKHGIERTIAVQAAPTLAETEYLLALSEMTDTIAGVVAWLDLDDPEHFSHYERLSKHPKLVGFRLMIQEMSDASAVLEPHFIQALKLYADKDIPVDLLVKSDQLGSLIELLERVPHLRGVVDHIAKPRIAEGILDPWRTQITEIARHKGIYCKLSGMITEADHKTWKPEQLLAYIRHTIDVFGPERVMFGSDWPVCLLAGSYDEVVQVLKEAIPESWTEAEREQLFGLNAKEFYKI